MRDISFSHFKKPQNAAGTKNTGYIPVLAILLPVFSILMVGYLYELYFIDNGFIRTPSTAFMICSIAVFIVTSAGYHSINRCLRYTRTHRAWLMAGLFVGIICHIMTLMLLVFTIFTSGLANNNTWYAATSFLAILWLAVLYLSDPN